MQKKVKKKHIEDAEEYAISLGVNLEDLDGFDTQYIYPKNTVTRKKYETIYKEREEYINDLYDDTIEAETILNNIKPKFTEKITLEEYDLLDDESKIRYHEYLISKSNEQNI